MTAHTGDPLVAGKFGWCTQCGGVEPVCGSVLVPIRETQPHYQYRFVWFPACPERHAMAALCDGCGKAPTREGYDYCVACWPEDADEPVRRDLVQPVLAPPPPAKLSQTIPASCPRSVMSR